MKQVICVICGKPYKSKDNFETNICDGCMEHYSSKALRQDKVHQTLVKEGI